MQERIARRLRIDGLVQGVGYRAWCREEAESRALFHEPRHPYTQALLESVLTPEPELGVPDAQLGQDRQRPQPILARPGVVPAAEPRPRIAPIQGGPRSDPSLRDGERLSDDEFERFAECCLNALTDAMESVDVPDRLIERYVPEIVDEWLEEWR